MPTLNVKLPRYTVAKSRRDGSQAFYFQVPKRLRPAGWAGGYRLPSDPLQRTGRGDAAEIALVVRDAEAFLARLETERIKTVHIWSDEELAEKMARAEGIGRHSIAVALLIAHDQGFRPTDTLRLQKGRDYDPKTGRFKFKCSKTGEWAECDATSRVRSIIATLPAEQLVLVVNEKTGKVYNERVFNRWFDEIRGTDKHLWFRELRHTHVVKARRAGLTSDEIAGRTAHSPRSVDKILEEFYSPHDTEVIQRGAAKFEAYINRPAEQESDMKVGRQLDAKA